MVINLPDRFDVKINLLSLKFDRRVRIYNMDKDLLKLLHLALKNKSLKDNKTLKVKFKEILYYYCFWYFL